jgi:hypothetical protein
MHSEQQPRIICFGQNSNKDWRKCARSLNRAMNGQGAAEVLVDRGLFLLAPAQAVKVDWTNQQLLYGISRSQTLSIGEEASGKA